MARKTRNHRLNLPPPLELRCMKALWALGEGTVHEIRSQLLSERAFAYTTVLTLMDRLARKGIVEREKQGRAHLYRPLVAEERILEQALARLLGDFFRGSREELRHYLDTQKVGGAEARLAKPDLQATERAVEASIDPTLL